MVQSFLSTHPLLGVDHKTLLQEVCKDRQVLLFLSVLRLHCLELAEDRLHRLGRLGDWLYVELSFLKWVIFLGEEDVAVLCIEVLSQVLRSFQQFVLELPFALHHHLYHFIVSPPWEHDLSCVELKEGGACTPDVNGCAETGSEENLWGSVVSAHYILGYLNFILRYATPKVAKLNPLSVFAHHYVVRFQVCMQKLESVKEAQGHEELPPVEADPIQTQTHVLAILVKCLPQIHLQTLIDQAQVILVVKVL